MKKSTLFLLLFLILSSNAIANELSWVDEQIEAIKPPRKGISSDKIALLHDPFIFLEEDTKKTLTKKRSKKVHKRKKTFHRKKVYSMHFTLEAIMNKSALINGKWYKEGSKISSYKLKKVNAKSVILTRGKKTVELSLLSKNKNLKIKNN